MTSQLAFALDVHDEASARAHIARLNDAVDYFKVGLELFIATGPALVRELGKKCFLDLKLHDIPETMTRAAASASAHGVGLLTVHACAGREALARVVSETRGTSTRVLAVTVLTSMDALALAEIGVASNTQDHVLRLADVALSAGVDGLVCSVQETSAMRAHFGDAPLIVTPGIRAVGANTGDQKRIATPDAAVRAGANVLVVGRPIRDAQDPLEAARAICSEMRNAETKK